MTMVGVGAIGFTAACQSDRGAEREVETVAVFGTNPEIGPRELVDLPAERNVQPPSVDLTPVPPVTITEEGDVDCTYAQAGPVGEAEVVEPPPVEAAGASAAVSGRLVNANRQWVQLVDPEGNLYSLRVRGQPEIVLPSGRATSVTRIPEGTPVRAGFEWVEGQFVLRELAVQPPSELRRCPEEPSSP